MLNFIDHEPRWSLTVCFGGFAFLFFLFKGGKRLVEAGHLKDQDTLNNVDKKD